MNLDNGWSIVDTPDSSEAIRNIIASRISENIDGHMLVSICDSMKIHDEAEDFGRINIISSRDFEFDYVSCKLIADCDTKVYAAPPKGRTQQAHNLIQNMNKRKR